MAAALARGQVVRALSPDARQLPGPGPPAGGSMSAVQYCSCRACGQGSGALICAPWKRSGFLYGTIRAFV